MNKSTGTLDSPLKRYTEVIKEIVITNKIYPYKHNQLIEQEMNNWLYIIVVYPLLPWNFISDGAKPVLITGTPGIGKLVFWMLFSPS